MAAVRMNITLPEKTAKKLKKAFRTRERSAIIADALELYFSRKSEADLVRELIVEYQAANAMSEEDKSWIELQMVNDED